MAKSVIGVHRKIRKDEDVDTDMFGRRTITRKARGRFDDR